MQITGKQSIPRAAATATTPQPEARTLIEQ